MVDERGEPLLVRAGELAVVRRGVLPEPVEVCEAAVGVAPDARRDAGSLRFGRGNIRTPALMNITGNPWGFTLVAEDVLTTAGATAETAATLSHALSCDLELKVRTGGTAVAGTHYTAPETVRAITAGVTTAALNVGTLAGASAGRTIEVDCTNGPEVIVKDEGSPSSRSTSARATVTIPCTDATPSALALTDPADDTALTLNEALAAATTAYTAELGSAVSQVTVTPIVNHSNATVAFLDGNGAALADAEVDKTGPAGEPRHGGDRHQGEGDGRGRHHHGDVLCGPCAGCARRGRGRRSCNGGVTAGSGYRVADGTDSAEVAVLDNDEAPSTTVETLWTSTLTVFDFSGIITGLYTGLGVELSPDGWTEDAAQFHAEQPYYYSADSELAFEVSAWTPESGQLALHLHDLRLQLIGVEGTTPFTWTMDDPGWDHGQTAAVNLTRTDPDASPVSAGPGVSVADAQVQEAEGAVLAFQVMLHAAWPSAVSVRYATSDGTATSGTDYVARSGALRFAPGETEKTVSVAVLNDAHDEGSETMALALPEPFGAEIADGAGTGTMVNTDPNPKAWIARFGRTVAEQVLEAVEARMRTPRAPGVEVSLAGLRVGGAVAPDGTDSAHDAVQWASARSQADRFDEQGTRERQIVSHGTLHPALRAEYREVFAEEADAEIEQWTQETITAARRTLRLLDEVERDGADRA